jgi:aminoglycoside phosphotransferase (APT) family kinase protein
MGFTYNDLQPSNIIVKEDRIVGIIDWEMAGFFGDRAAKVHRRFRHPGKEAFARVALSELELERATCGNWVDLYDTTFLAGEFIQNI